MVHSSIPCAHSRQAASTRDAGLQTVASQHPRL